MKRAIVLFFVFVLVSSCVWGGEDDGENRFDADFSLRPGYRDEHPYLGLNLKMGLKLGERNEISSRMLIDRRDLARKLIAVRFKRSFSTNSYDLIFYGGVFSRYHTEGFENAILFGGRGKSDNVKWILDGRYFLEENYLGRNAVIKTEVFFSKSQGRKVNWGIWSDNLAVGPLLTTSLNIGKKWKADIKTGVVYDLTGNHFHTTFVLEWSNRDGTPIDWKKLRPKWLRKEKKKKKGGGES